MAEHLEHIEDYFQNKLSTEQRVAFEKRITEDESFAGEVAFYMQAREALAEELAIEKKKRFRSIYTPVATQKRSIVRRLAPYMSAAAVLILVVGIFMFRQDSYSDLANKYIRDQLTQQPVYMSTQQDTLAKAMILYNAGKLDESLAILNFVIRTDSSKSVYSAKKVAGIVYLRKSDYDKAIQLFEELEKNESLYENYGKFYHAISLMKRNGENDEQRAKELLKQVVNEGLPGKETAQEWIR